MALPEACGVWIEQRIQESLDAGDGKSLRAIGREVAKEVEKYFEVTVKPGTIKERARRMKSGTNVPSQSNNQNHSGKVNSNKIKRKNKTAKDGTMRGGKRPGAGRPKKEAGTNWEHGLNSQTTAEQPSASGKWDREIHMVSDAMGFAQMAISQLERIRDDDPQQIQVYLSVIDWVFGKMRKRVKGMKQEIAWGVVDKSLQSLVGKYMMDGLKISPKPSPKVMRRIENGINDLQLFFDQLTQPK